MIMPKIPNKNFLKTTLYNPVFANLPVHQQFNTKNNENFDFYQCGDLPQIPIDQVIS